MDFENEEARLVFLRYALPCSETLVKRGVISQSYRRRLMKAIFLNKKIPENSEKIFKVANLMCEKIAKRFGKKSIDKNIVRKYFLFNHDKIVDRRYKIFRDFDPLICRLYSGKVINMKNGKAVVQTIIGRKKYKMYPFQNLKKGDSVVVHRDIVIEKINESLAKKLWKLKESYFKSNKI
jgi:hydrogenase maturation factor